MNSAAHFNKLGAKLVLIEHTVHKLRQQKGI